MTIQEKHNILNSYYGVIEKNKGFLADTDYKTIREAEGGEPMDEETKAARAESRATIELYQNWVNELEPIIPDEDDDAILMNNFV